jgi:hypothetical protein
MNRMGIGSIIFLIGAVIYVLNLIVNFMGRGMVIRIDSIGLMILGIGLFLVFKR